MMHEVNDMNKKRYLVVSIMSGICMIVYAKNDVLNSVPAEVIPAIAAEKPAAAQPAVPEKEQATQKKKKKDPLIHFSFENEDLVKIVNRIAAKKGMNVILPQGPEAIAQKVTFKQPKRIPLSQAEEYLKTFLTLSGYGMRYEDPFYTIERIDPGLTHSPLPLYINVLPKDLPNDYIRAVYYLANLRVPDNTQGSEPLTVILKDMLSTNGNFIFDPKSNGIIITDKGSVIGSAMTIINELDLSGSKDTIIVVPLFNSVATTVAELIKSQLVAAAGGAQQPGLLRADYRTESGIYFATNTRVVADPRSNALIIMGRETAVRRLQEFVQEFMDAPQDSGRSILHVYDLQYLDAESFAGVLRGIIESRGNAGQSQKEITGPEQFFDGVRVVSETYKPVEAGKAITGGAATIETKGTVYQGGNRLVITARQKDWVRIKSLIQELDRPQRQVILRMMIVDVTLDRIKKIASQTRNPASWDFPPGFEFQSAQMTGQVLDNPTAAASATTLAADLLRILAGSDPAKSLAIDETTGPANNGSIIFSVNDPSGSGIWSVFQVLQKYTEISVLSHPFLVTLDNVKAEESIKTIRRGEGNQSIGEGAVSTIKQNDYTAQLNVGITPRVSSLDRVNLQIAVEITDFISADISNFTRVTRTVETNANMSTGQILVLGGLTIDAQNDGQSGFPILSQIPLIGWLFRAKDQRITKNNLAIFISPTVVEPKLREGSALFTADRINRGYDNVESGLAFDSLKDPITRWFFHSERDSNATAIDHYLSDVPVKHQEDQDALHLAYDENKELEEYVTQERNPLLDAE